LLDINYLNTVLLQVRNIFIYFFKSRYPQTKLLQRLQTFVRTAEHIEFDAAILWKS